MSTRPASSRESTGVSRSQRPNRRVVLLVFSHCRRGQDPACPRASSPSPAKTCRGRMFSCQEFTSPMSQRVLLAASAFPSSLSHSSCRSRVQRDVHSRHNTEEKRIGRCGGDGPRPKPRLPCQGGDSGRSWWRLSHGPFSRLWCWVTAAASFRRTWWSGSDNHPGDDTIHH
jgi:hypothetical protein